MKRSLAFASAVVFAGLIAGTSAVRAQTITITGETNSASAPFDQLMTSLIQKYSLTGGQLAVTKNGKLVLAHGYGWADSAAQTVVQPDSLFRIASLSKQFTAVAILQLVQQGKLKLDDPAFALLPDLPPLVGMSEDSRLASITIRNLLQHSGGWDFSTGYDPMFDSLHIASVVGVASPPSTRDIIRYMRGRRLDFTPGTRYVYSNFGYAVLGRIIEKITGVSYEQYVRTNVLTPVGITDMKIGQTLIAGKQQGEVTYYMEPGAALAQSVFSKTPGSLPWPYGGFYLEAMDSHGAWLASAIDLLKFWNGIDGRRGNALLTSSSLGLLTARPLIPDWASSSYWYGLGFLIRPSGGDANWWHDGSLPGTRTWAVRTYNGYAWAALFNERRSDSTLDSQFATELDNGLWNAAAAVSNWPATDLFPAFTPSSSLPHIGSFAQVASGGGWKTSLTLMNLTANTVNAQINFYSEDGSPMLLPLTLLQSGNTTTASAQALSLGPNESYVIQTEAAGTAVKVGWADVQALGNLAGYSIFRYRSPGLADSEGTATLDIGSPTSVVLPYDNSAGFHTGMALANLGTTTNNITATVLDLRGSLLSSQQVTLGPLGHMSFFIDQQFPAAANQLGILQLQSSAGLTVIGLRFSPTGTFTSVPVSH